MKFKLDAVTYSKEHSNYVASKYFKLTQKRIIEWRASKAKLLELNQELHGPDQRKLKGGGRKPIKVGITNEWVVDKLLGRIGSLSVWLKCSKNSICFNTTWRIDWKGWNVSNKQWLAYYLYLNTYEKEYLFITKKNVCFSKDPEWWCYKKREIVLFAHKLQKRHSYSPANFIATDETSV